MHSCLITRYHTGRTLYVYEDTELSVCLPRASLRRTELSPSQGLPEEWTGQPRGVS